MCVHGGSTVAVVDGPDVGKQATADATGRSGHDRNAVLDDKSMRDPEAIARVLSVYRVYAKKVPLKDGDYTMHHTAIVYLMDKTGHFVAPFNMRRTPEAAEIKHAELAPASIEQIKDFIRKGN